MKRISLIVPTLDKFESVIQLLKSVEKSIVIEIVEIVIIDQNLDYELCNYIQSKFFDLNIVYLRSTVKGLSKARNKGLSYAQGDIIVFSDDDVIYKDDYFSKLLIFERNNPSTDVFISKLLNIENDEHYTIEPKPLYLTNGLINYMSCCSVTLNVRKESIISFNEKLGAGEYFGACEDSDFVMRLFRNKAKFNYFEDLIVRHPKFMKNQKGFDRIKSYSLGFGAFYKIQIKRGGRYQLYFIKSFIILIIRSIGGMILDPINFKHYYYSLIYKLKGYLKFSYDNL